MFKKIINKIADKTNTSCNKLEERLLLSNGAILSKQQSLMTSNVFNDYEFKIFSQFGDDGLIQYLIKNIDIQNETFIEFGVEDYLESNTRFLLMNNNWRGFVMDGSAKNMENLKHQDWFWMYDLCCKAVFIDKFNINSLLSETKFENIGLLNIDLDGNDYWILETLDLSTLNPSILILEYNSVFGKDRAITVPYDKDFIRNEKHYSNLYWGASLKALEKLASEKGYALVGSNSTGCNAFFVRKDLLTDKIKQKTVAEAYFESKYRESRNEDNSLSYLRAEERLNAIKGLDVMNVETNQIEKL